jgi:NADH dehydrogenase FAD-containing subunit
LRLSDGGSLSADLIISATGARPANALAATITGSQTDANGRIIVDPWLRVAGRSNLFALGDVAATADLMTIVAISRQAPWLAKAIKAMIAGKAVTSVKPYTPWQTPPILVPLGPGGGASVLPLLPGGTVVWAGLTALIKGKSLFIPRYHKEFGRP